jgi:hypothetical protein
VIHDGRPQVGLPFVLNMHGIPRGEASSTSQEGRCHRHSRCMRSLSRGLHVAAARGLRSADPSWVCLPHVIGEEEAGLLKETGVHVAAVLRLVFTHREAALAARWAIGGSGARERLSAVRLWREADGCQSMPPARAPPGASNLTPAVRPVHTRSLCIGRGPIAMARPSA